MHPFLKRVLLALAALAFPALAAVETRTCEVTNGPDGALTVACRAPAAVPGPTTTPTPPGPPTQPPAPPTEPAPPPTPTAACPPNISPFICAILGAGNPTGNGGPSAPAGGGNGTTFDDLTFDFRDGAIRRYVGSSTKTAIATRPGLVSFSVGDSGGNAAAAWRITLTVNGRVVHESTASTYQVVPDGGVRVNTGDVIVLTIVGQGVVASARLAIS